MRHSMNRVALAAFLTALISWLALTVPHAQVGMPWPGPGTSHSSGGGCSQATTANAALDGSQNSTAVTTLICNLVSGGVWANLDVMHLYAINSAGNSLINIVNPGTYNATLLNSPSFSANAGYTGTDCNSACPTIDTNFNPATATSPHFTQNSAHYSAWSNTQHQATAGGPGGLMGLYDSTGSTVLNQMLPYYSDGNVYLRVNDAGGSGGVANTNSKGHFLANRSGASAQQGYINAVNKSITSVSSAALSGASGNFYVLSLDTCNSGTCNIVGSGGAYQAMSATIGGSLTSGQVTTLCHQINLYLTTVGGVSSGVC